MEWPLPPELTPQTRYRPCKGRLRGAAPEAALSAPRQRSAVVPTYHDPRGHRCRHWSEMQWMFIPICHLEGAHCPPMFAPGYPGTGFTTGNRCLDGHATWARESSRKLRWRGTRNPSPATPSRYELWRSCWKQLSGCYLCTYWIRRYLSYQLGTFGT